MVCGSNRYLFGVEKTGHPTVSLSPRGEITYLHLHLPEVSHWNQTSKSHTGVFVGGNGLANVGNAKTRIDLPTKNSVKFGLESKKGYPQLSFVLSKKNT